MLLHAPTKLARSACGTEKKEMIIIIFCSGVAMSTDLGARRCVVLRRRVRAGEPYQTAPRPPRAQLPAQGHTLCAYALDTRCAVLI